MKVKQVEGRMRGVRDVLESNISDQDFIYQLSGLGVDVDRTKTGDPLGPFNFRAKSQRLAEACEVAFLLGRFLGRREMIDVAIADIDAENREQAIEYKERSDRGVDKIRALSEPRRIEILEKYATWAAKPNSVRLSDTAFAIRLSAQKRRKNIRGFGKSTVMKFISEFNAGVIHTWQALRASSADRSSAVVARITNEMASQPGVNRDTVRRAIGP